MAEQVKQLAILRMQMMPYWYSEFAKYYFDGTPPFRGMALEPGFQIVGTTEKNANAYLEENPYAEATSKEINAWVLSGFKRLI